jgi:hypothetical protein
VKKAVLFCKKEPENFCESGPGALAAPKPMAQIHKRFLRAFLQKSAAFFASP